MAGYELSRDADGNVVLVPSTAQPQKPKGFLDDVASKAREYFLPRGSDFTKGTDAVYGAGQDISRRGYENLKTNPLYGAGQVIGGSALSAISPLAGATEYVTKPVGRTLGPAPEHAAEIASMFVPLPSKGASMLKPRPKAAPVAEFANIPREFSYLPRDMQETINAMRPADREQVFALLRQDAQATAPAARSAPTATSEAVETARSISPVEMAVKQSKYPGRFLHPETGQAQSVFDPLLGQNKAAMGAIHDPFEALAQRVSEMPGPVDYLTRPRPVINPETGNQLQAIGPKGQFGPYRYEFTPGQRVAQGAALAAPSAAVGFGLSNLIPNPSATAASGPRDMDRGNSLGVDELSAYPSGAVRRGLDRTNALGVDELSAYPAGAVHKYNRSNAPGVDELSAYPRSPVQLAKEQMAASNRARAQEALSQPRRPADEGMFSKIFNNPLSTRELYQRSQDNPEDAGAYMRAERQYAATHRDAPSFDLTKLNEQGMKRGGSVNGKPDSVHKALEIIHHLLTRGH